jgi:hypothetical protein
MHVPEMQSPQHGVLVEHAPDGMQQNSPPPPEQIEPEGQTWPHEPQLLSFPM